MKNKEKPDDTFNQEFEQILARRRLDKMAELQNKLVDEITKAHLPSQDVYMVLTVLRSQLHSLFNKGRQAYEASTRQPEPKPETKKDETKKDE